MPKYNFSPEIQIFKGIFMIPEFQIHPAEAYFCRSLSRFMRRTIPIFLLFGLLAACTNNDRQNTGPENNIVENIPAPINYSVVKIMPHDTTSFTEGLLFHNGQLYESTGRDSDWRPSIRNLFGIVDPVSGKIHPKVVLDGKKYFGEGAVFLKDKLYQLTYRTKVGFIYDAKTFAKLGEFKFPSAEGWGMTTDGARLIMSDGSSNITYLDPESFQTARILGVTDNNGPVSNINELELINGFLYSNQWETNYILKIDTSSGKVVGKLDLSALHDSAKNINPECDVLNGIAYDPATGRIYVTGKLWPNIYEIKFPI
jgi:glutamine cyclotransferase